MMKNKQHTFVWKFNGEKCVTMIIRIDDELIISASCAIVKEVHKKVLKKHGFLCYQLPVVGMAFSNLDYWRGLIDRYARREGLTIEETMIDLPIVANSSELECNC